ncbi:glycoside hydrolase family 20 zincin-like fold domain-containing protein [Schleiferiaceae bacterium]|nr:glycoside hydrolase family 20 zincin-like fold domain-containing protein [Schleiferiaceae bacterium]
MKKFLVLMPLAALIACQSMPITPSVSPVSMVPQPLLVEVEEGQSPAILEQPVRFVNLKTADFALTQAWPQAEDGFPIVFCGGYSPEDFHGGQGAEGAYSLDVYADSIVVHTESDAGRYNALATLMQLVPVEHWPTEKGGGTKARF